MKKEWKNEKVMSKKEFNRDYMVRVRAFFDDRKENRLCGYDFLRDYLGEYVFECVLKRARFARAQKFVCRPYHWIEVTFYAH